MIATRTHHCAIRQQRPQVQLATRYQLGNQALRPSIINNRQAPERFAVRAVATETGWAAEDFYSILGVVRAHKHSEAFDQVDRGRSAAFGRVLQPQQTVRKNIPSALKRPRKFPPLIAFRAADAYRLTDADQ